MHVKNLPHHPVPTAPAPLDFDHWQDCASQVFVPLTVRPRDVADFSGRLNQVACSGTTAVRLEAKPHMVQRTPENIRSGGSGYFKFSLQLEGNGLLIQDGRETTLTPGDLTVYDTSQPYTLSYADPASMFVLMVPHERFGGMLPDVVELVATRLGEDGLSEVVVPYLTSLAARLTTGRQGTNARLLHHAVDLLETLCSDEADRLLEADEDRAVSSAKQKDLRRILRYVDEHLADPQLSPQSIAEAHFMSVRSLYKLFDDTGTTVAAWIRGRRLERAKEALLNPANCDVPVARIAADFGLLDPAHFSRLIRSAYGVPPSQLRRQALQA